MVAVVFSQMLELLVLVLQRLSMPLTECSRTLLPVGLDVSV